MKSPGLMSLMLILICRVAIGGGEVTAIPHILRNHVLDEHEEFEFLPSGKLISYEFTETELAVPLSRRNVSRRVYPFLFIEEFKWKMGGGRILIGRSDPKFEFWYNKKESCFTIFEHTYTEEKNLTFFDMLGKYCGDSVLHGTAETKTLHKPEHSAGLPFHFLHAVTPDGFNEYEFYPDGKVIAYYDMENRSKDVETNAIDSFHPRFMVELLPWQKKNQQVVIDHGDKGEEVLKVSKDRKKVTSDRTVWEPVDHLEFIPRLFTFCERPLPK